MLPQRAVLAVLKSPLTQGRELKFKELVIVLHNVTVAPHAGARIEIFGIPLHLLILWSPLTQGRELK